MDKTTRFWLESNRFCDACERFSEKRTHDDNPCDAKRLFKRYEKGKDKALWACSLPRDNGYSFNEKNVSRKSKAL